ncbi:eukaryotic translation initiation factor, partial [Haematococcus lacustris]
AKLMWNKTGSALLVMSYADVDATNQSYYGEQKLHYMPADPKRSDATATVALPKDGPVHDVQWSPAGDFFLTVAGFMPAKASSDILFFDKKASGVCKQMAAVRSPAVSAEWSPDGRQLLIATTAPRLRVDNKTCVLDYQGVQVATRPFDCLFEASWLPCHPDAFPDRPQSPSRAAGTAASPTPGAPGGAGKGPQPVAQTVKTAGYVPPHLRAAGVEAAPAPSFSLGFDNSDLGGKIGANKTRPVPGFEFADSKAANKNAKKRANKKKAQAGDGGSGAADDEELSQPAGAADNTSHNQDPAKPATTSNSAAVSVAGSMVAIEGGVEMDPSKRLRALQKKLRQVEALREKSRQGPLEPEQLAKLQSEAALVAEINALELSMR